MNSSANPSTVSAGAGSGVGASGSGAGRGVADPPSAGGSFSGGSPFSSSPQPAITREATIPARSSDRFIGFIVRFWTRANYHPSAGMGRDLSGNWLGAPLHSSMFSVSKYSSISASPALSAFPSFLRTLFGISITAGSSRISACGKPILPILGGSSQSSPPVAPLPASQAGSAPHLPKPRHPPSILRPLPPRRSHGPGWWYGRCVANRQRCA